MDYLEFESFFHQLVPMHDAGMNAFGNINPSNNTLMPAHDHQSFVPSPNNGVFLPTLNNEKKGVKRSLDSPENEDEEGMEENEKQKVRRANQNLACRNYRRRKKEYVHELETKITSLEAELDQLRKDTASLKRGEAMEAVEPQIASMLAEMKQILEKLEDAVKNNLDDKTIAYLLQLFFLAIEKRHGLVNKDIDMIVNPLLQARLATFGYVPALEHPIVSNISGPAGNEWWASYAQDARITEDQARCIKDIRERHWKLDTELRMERNTLDRTIKEFYLQNLKLIPTGHSAKNNSFAHAAGLDMGEVIEFARQLNCMKKNFIAQRTLMLDVQTQLNKILTPRQHAILLLRINQSRTFDWPRHIQTLRSAWQLFSDDNNQKPSVQQV